VPYPAVISLPEDMDRESLCLGMLRIATVFAEKCRRHLLMSILVWASSKTACLYRNAPIEMRYLPPAFCPNSPQQFPTIGAVSGKISVLRCSAALRRPDAARAVPPHSIPPPAVRPKLLTAGVLPRVETSDRRARQMMGAVRVVGGS
jgi:hypothetical protein